jgi:hypothetical protein
MCEGARLDTTLLSNEASLYLCMYNVLGRFKTLHCLLQGWIPASYRFLMGFGQVFNMKLGLGT